MEELEKKKIYFIYSQYGETSNIAKIEKNNFIEKINDDKKLEIKKESDYIYIVYNLTLNDDYKGEPFPLLLIDKDGELFYSKINSKNIEKFKYEVYFESFYDKNITLNQFILPYIKQFKIFKESIIENDVQLLNELLLNSINNLIENELKFNYDFILNIFFETYKLYKKYDNDNDIKNTLKKYFEEFNFKILENLNNDNNNNSETLSNLKLDLDKEDLNLLSNIHKIRNELIRATGNKEKINEKIDAFLGYYCIYYDPKLFILLVDSKNENFENIKYNLMKYKKLFCEFNENIMSRIMEETSNLEQIKFLIKNFIPNMVELFKLLKDQLFFLKLVYMVREERKGLLDIMELCKPQEKDDIKMLNNYFEDFIDLFLQERALPVSIGKDFYLKYSGFFINKDFDKIELIHRMLNTYNIHVTDKFKIKIDEELDKYYHDTGMYLINNQNLLNMDVIEFLKEDPYFKNKKNKIPTDIIYKGIIFKEDDNKFTNSFLNNNFDDFDLKEFFGNDYYHLIKYIFKEFKTPKDLLKIKKWEITYDINEEVVENFLNIIKVIWLSDPKNHMYGLERLIANEFGKASLKVKDYEKIIDDIENGINSDYLLVIYSEILYRDYPLTPKFQDHIKDFIHKKCDNDDKNAISIWYLLNTIEKDDFQKYEFLKKNLKEKYAVQAKDFVNYPSYTDGKITLFANLYNGRFFRNNEIKQLPYYTISTNSKDNIFDLTFNETMKMYQNIEYFQNLFLFFIPGDFSEENNFIVDYLLIEFSDRCEESKKHYDSLNTINNFWNKFFQNEMKDERNNLTIDIKNYEKTSLKEYKKLYNETSRYLDFLPEAKEGERLMESFFFMAIYNSFKEKYNNERERYDNSIKKFNELKQLGINSDTNLLEKELKNILVISIYKNKDRLNNELHFLKSFFDFNSEKNKENNNYKYNLTELKKSFLNLVKEYQEKEGLKDYVININDILLDINEDKDELNQNINKEGNILNENNKEAEQSQKQILKEKEELINKLKKLENNYLSSIKTIYSKKNKNQKSDLIIKIINNYFSDFYNEIFETNFGLAKLDDIKLVFLLSKKIYINKIELINEKTLILISEFMDILDIFIEYQKISKKLLFSLLKCFYDLEKAEKYEISLKELFSLIKTNLKENEYDENKNNLWIKLLLKEQKKLKTQNYNKILIDLVFPNNEKDKKYFINIYTDLMPFIDTLFNEDIKKILDFKDKENKNNIFSSKNLNINIIEKCEESKSFEEILLYYFETKISLYFYNECNKDNNNENNENEIFNKDNIKEHFEKNLEYLDNYYKNNKSNKNSKACSIIKLYSIAFIKYFLNRSVYFYYKSPQISKNMEDIAKNKLKGSNDNLFRKSMKMYLLKLFFENIDDLYDFKNFKFNNIFENNFLKETIEEELKNETNKKYYGFDYMIIPLKEDQIEKFKDISECLLNIKNNDENYDDSIIIEKIKEYDDIDVLYCGLLNIHFSFYHNEFYLEGQINDDNKKNLELNKWIENKINDEQKGIEILQNNEILKQILLLFTNFSLNDKFNLKLCSSNKELLYITISARYVLKTIAFNNKEGLYYNIICNFQDAVSKGSDYFKYYLKDFNTYIKENRNIKYLTYKIINCIILSHLYFSYILGNAELNQIYKLLSIEPTKDKKYLIKLLINEFDFIKDNLLSLIGIKKFIIFMNSIFDETSLSINKINYNIDNNNIKLIEESIDKEIFEKISQYKNIIEDYYTTINKFQIDKEYIENNENNNGIDNNKKIFKKIFFENNEFFNDIDKKYSPEEKCPFITYLTSTNFCTFDDFKYQYLYFENDPKTYPMIDCILKNNNIFEIVNLIPKLNLLINKIYNKLLLRISEEEINQQIKTKINNIEIDLNKKYNIDDIELILTNDSKISEVINIKNNKIFEIYNLIIIKYNEFLSNTKIFNDNKDYMKPVIIQSANDNDFITFNIKKKNKNKYNNEYDIISAKQRLSQIFYLYSKRNRIENDLINVIDGGRIIYNYKIIEKELQEEFLFGKKLFSETQKTFIFSNNVFSEERKDILIRLNEKYPQNEIEDEKTIIEELFKIINKENIKDILINIYYDLQYIIIYLMTYDNNLNDNIDNKDNKIKISYIINVIENENYEINEYLHEFTNKYDDSLFINNLLSFYGIIELKVFDYLTNIIKEKIDLKKIEIDSDTKEKILKNFKTKENDLLFSKEIIINAIKKYILRYCIGDNKNINNILEKLDNIFVDIFNKKDIWEEIIYKDKRFKEESNKLISINKEKNIIINYCLNILFGEEEEENNNLEKEKDEIDEQNELTDDLQNDLNTDDFSVQISKTKEYV